MKIKTKGIQPFFYSCPRDKFLIERNNFINMINIIIDSEGFRWKKWKGKINPLCDFEGKCKNIAFKEVYPMLIKGKYHEKGWNYLCQKHFNLEFKRLKKELPYSEAEWDKKDHTFTKILK